MFLTLIAFWTTGHCCRLKILLSVDKYLAGACSSQANYWLAFGKLVVDGAWRLLGSLRGCLA
jgi:hypothetical protein